MKRIVIYILLLAVAVLMPVERADVGKLIPAELIHIYKEGDDIVIETDTGSGGRGKTVDGAVGNLKSTTAGIVYLDTARYLLVEEEAMRELVAVSAYLKSSVRVCAAGQDTDLQKAAAYLAVHPPKQRLGEMIHGKSAERLLSEGGKMILKEI